LQANYLTKNCLFFEFSSSEYGRGLLFNNFAESASTPKELAMSSQWLKLWFPHLPSAMDRAPMAGLMCAGALLLGVALAGARSSLPNENGAGSGSETTANSTAKSGEENSAKIVRFREGDDLADRVGQFKINNGRVVFILDETQQRLIVLENLALDRVAKTIEGNPASLPWVASGKITEFHGAYYLLLSRVQLKTQAQPNEQKP
jgi:hypothetical protein